MKENFIFVTGYFGAPIEEAAKKLAADNGCELLYLDKEIEKADGRSVLRICMLMGEHEYRNKEYEALSAIVSGKIASGAKGAVICCGDGVLNDEMSAEIIKSHRLVIVGADMTADQLWENAKSQKESVHAFMHFGSEDSRRKAFEELYERQRALYSSVTAG